MRPNKRLKGNPVNGMLLLDKPAGLSSNQALQQVKYLLNARKAGHTGSLDPIATGLLPICFGETTRICGVLLHADKTYHVHIRLGVATATGDKEGVVIERKPIEFDRARLEQVMQRYRGQYEQIPPMYSALKKHGQPLYKLARRGIVVARRPRPVTVYALVVESWENDILILSIACSRGFYIRTLAEDIGQDLGCGAHVEQLRRTKVGVWTLDQAFTIQQIEAVTPLEQRQNLPMPTERGLAHLPEIRVSENLVKYIRLGQSVRMDNAGQGLVRLYAETGSFIGLGEVTADKVAPKRLFAG